MQADRRTAQRRSIRIPISCWATDDGRPVGPGQSLVCRDLSATGMAFDARTLYPIDSLLVAEIPLPGRSTPLVTRMRVNRLESVPGGGSYRIGVLFVDIRPEDRDSIVACLCRSDIYSIVGQGLAQGASDVHLTVGKPPVLRTKGRLLPLEAEPIVEGQIKAMLEPLLNEAQIRYLENQKELDFAFSPSVRSRFRVNLHFQRGFLEATLRSVPTSSSSFEELGLPREAMERFCRAKAGLILIAGTTGSGKTTTMASMVDYINRNLERVVITIEDPIEFTHSSQRSLIKQRELGTDTLSYAEALRRSLRQDPDVIVVGELTDGEGVLSALRAAETGHLVISTIHAPDAEQSIERLVNLFPPEHGAGLCQQLASCLLGILHQVLIPGREGNQLLGTELLICNHAIRNLIRERRFAQIHNCIQTGRNHGMYTLQSRLEQLHQEGLIDQAVLRKYAG
jgi:twitching motility protein PilT